MPTPRVELNHEGMAALLKDDGVAEFVHATAERVAEAARESAPRKTGAFADSFVVEDVTTDRAVSRVVSTDPLGLFKEVKHRTLTNALSRGGK